MAWVVSTFRITRQPLVLSVRMRVIMVHPSYLASFGSSLTPSGITYDDPSLEQMTGMLCSIFILRSGIEIRWYGLGVYENSTPHAGHCARGILLSTDTTFSLFRFSFRMYTQINVCTNGAQNTVLDYSWVSYLNVLSSSQLALLSKRFIKEWESRRN